MATVLETFFAKLGFEVDEGGFANAQNKLANVSKSILGLGIFSGVSVAGIMKLVTSTAAALGAIDRLSQRTGIATDAIQAMSAAGRDFDITSEGMQQTLTNVNNALGAAILQEPRAVNMFKLLGLSAKDSAGHQKDVVTFLGDVAQRMQSLPSGAQARMLTKLGIDPGMITMLRNGREAFMELYETASQGAVFPQEDLTRAAQFENLFRRVRGILTTIGRNIGLELMRPMVDMLERINKWWGANGKRMMEDMRGRLRMWVDMFSRLTNVFSGFSKHGDTIVRIVEALGVALGLLLALKVAQWIGSILTAFGGWGAVILALGAAIYLLVDDFLTWRAGGESFIGYLEQQFPETFRMLREGWQRVKTAALELWDTLKKFWAENGPAIRAFAAELGTLAVTVGLEALVLALNGVRRSLEAISAIVKYLTPITRDWWAGQKKQAEDFNAVMLKVQAWWDGLGITSENVGERIKATWKDWGTEIQSDWANALAFMKNNLTQWGAEIESDWEKVKTGWGNMTTGLQNVWSGLVDGIKGKWQGFVDWFMPILERIQNFFGMVTNAPATVAGAVSGAAKKAFSWLPSLPSFTPAPAMAGGAPPMMPSSVANNNAQTQTNNTEVTATINMQAPNPEQAAEMTARKIDDLARTNVRHGQSFDF